MSTQIPKIMDDVEVIIVPEEDRAIAVPWEERTIVVPEENRVIEVGHRGQTMAILASKAHTISDSKRWTVDYSKWVDDTAEIQTIEILSSSTTLTIQADPEVLGKEIVFFTVGGALNEQATVSLKMTDTLGNIKNDTIMFTVIDK